MSNPDPEPVTCRALQEYERDCLAKEAGRLAAKWEAHAKRAHRTPPPPWRS